jgi:uncharacterized protein DUF742
MSGVLPVVDTRDQPEPPPTPTALPLGPRSAVPASRKSLARREKKDKRLPLAPKATTASSHALADEGPWLDQKVDAPPPPPADPRGLVRPYTRTGGRTRAGYRLELETLLSTPFGRDRDIQTLRNDHRIICEMCRMPHSTAEIAARLGLPLGAARVLIGDVVSLALLFVHETAKEGPSMDLLQRVAAGLKKL